MKNASDVELLIVAATTMSLAGADELATRLVDLAKRLVADEATKALDASPTRQEPARAPITEPVRVVVRSDFGAPPGVEIESVMKVAGIPGRVCSKGIEVKFGVVEWECRPTGDVAITWWPSGR